MAEFPALPLWTDAYFADTRHLSREEHGAYLLLLMEAWRRPNCDLPDDDAILSRLVLASQAEWAALKPAVMAFWKRDGRSKTWTQKRLKQERMYVADVRAKKREAAAKRWKKTENADADANHMQSTHTHTHTLEKKKTTSSSKRRGSRLPAEWVLPKAWGEWAVAEGMAEARVRHEADQFRDYWLGLGGQKACKVDWQATWRKWCRTAMEREAQRIVIRPAAHSPNQNFRTDPKTGRQQTFVAGIGWRDVLC